MTRHSTRHGAPATQADSGSIPGSTRAFTLMTAVIVAVALLLRVGYLFGTQVDVLIAGDINAYFHYARNLGLHGIYSSAAAPPLVADSFRPPGYPLFLLVAMQLGGYGAGWVGWAMQMQIALSTATVLFTILLGREWMRPGWALLAGALLAAWPHHIVFASTLLSETLLGFLAVLAMYLCSVAYRRQSVVFALATGLVFAAAALVNTVLVLFPLLPLLGTALTQRKRLLLPLALAWLVPIACWSWVAPAAPPGGSGNADRAWMNFVQGSWPLYHKAWRNRGQHEVPRAIMRAIDEEIRIGNEDRSDGLRVVAERLGTEPMRYLRWYAFEKPWLLWDWDIQLGWGGIHFLKVLHSPYERPGFYKSSLAVLKTANPAIFAATVLGALLVLLAVARRRPVPFGLLQTASFVVYVTAIHTVLQAEPRYSIPYRPEQLLLAVHAIAWAVKWGRQKIAAKNGDASIGLDTTEQIDPRNWDFTGLLIRIDNVPDGIKAMLNDARMASVSQQAGSLGAQPWQTARSNLPGIQRRLSPIRYDPAS